MVSVGFLEAAYTNVHMVPPFITQILWATQQFPKYILYKKRAEEAYQRLSVKAEKNHIRGGCPMHHTGCGRVRGTSLEDGV